MFHSVDIFQLVLLVASICSQYFAQYNLQSKLGLPLVCQILSWSTLVCSVFLPALAPTNVLCRLLGIGLALFPVYMLLSMSHEALFVVAFVLLLYCWLQLETRCVYGAEKVAAITKVLYYRTNTFILTLYYTFSD